MRRDLWWYAPVKWGPVYVFQMFVLTPLLLLLFTPAFIFLGIKYVLERPKR